MNSKILIVEDEFIVANDLRLILNQSGYNVIGIAVSAEEAFEYISKYNPDLILLDIRLEGNLSGIDIAKKLKEDNRAFIFLSANSDRQILEEAKKTEPYGFLVKPFREKDLLIALDIAAYRHKNSLESRLVQEDILYKKLKEINIDGLGLKEYLLQIGCLIQSYIPFDFILSESISNDNQSINNFGYFRVGFNEYQYIGENEISVITGLKNNIFSPISIKNAVETATIICQNQNINENSILALIRNHFKTESYIVFPFKLSDGTKIKYTFCSRKSDIYSNFHVELLNSLQICLAELTEKIITNYKSSNVNWNKSETSVKASHKKEKPLQFTTIIGRHPLLLEALDLVLQVAPYNTSVLILGESGTGKEKIAQSIHTLSTRKDKPFIKINCAAIPPSLIESELFGHEKGAFTGALEKRKGKFELADGGTIFLDEIGELSLDMQVRLLRVLQEKEIDSVGGSLSKKVDIRIVAATNRNLEKEVADGNFRLDLYYRLNVFPITLPPLRERKTDINELSVYFAEKFCRDSNKEFAGITQNMMNQLYEYNWPGNIRELENVIERSIILNDGKSELELKQNLISIETELSVKKEIQNLEEVKQVQKETERDFIISILKNVKGRIRGSAGAAAILNIKPTTLESKMAKLGIHKEDFVQ